MIVTDLKTKDELAVSLEKLKDLKNIKYVFGEHRMEDLSGVDMVIKNPAGRWDNEYVKAGQDSDVWVEMDSSLFFKFCKNPIIGVTGTRGKTTTASLIYEMLKVAGKNPIKIGNWYDRSQSYGIDRTQSRIIQDIVRADASNDSFCGSGSDLCASNCFFNKVISKDSSAMEDPNEIVGL